MTLTDMQSRSDSKAPRRVSVCVATCERPIGLANLLGAFEVLEISVHTALQVVVVDNDPAGSAKAVCDEFCARHAYPLRYVAEKRRGIPFARNTALSVALSDSDFVAFIDDDEIPESGWLAELLRVQALYGADVVTGPCLPHYLEPPPHWVVEGGFHELPRHSMAGTTKIFSAASTTLGFELSGPTTQSFTRVSPPLARPCVG